MKENKNLYIDQVETQINTTLEALQSKKLLYMYNHIRKEEIGRNKWIITWKNHESGRFNTGEYFLNLEQYKKILNNNSYLCILYDGSIIRVSYTFENNVLMGHNLLWWPAPYNYKGITLDDMSPNELMDEFLNDNRWDEVLRMRSPIRVDYEPDPEKVNESHSPTHIHMQNKDCRMYVKNPLCFNRFMNFILKNYYPNLIFEFDKHDYIEFKSTNSFDSLIFSEHEIVI